MSEYEIGQEVEVLRQREPDLWKRAFIRSLSETSGFCGVTMRASGIETHAILDHIRPLDMSLGDLEGEFELVDGCNGIYVYHASGHCTGAGDGTETTLADLAADARQDPDGFREAYGPPDNWRQCEVCEQWLDTDYYGFHCVGLGDPPHGAWVCDQCYPDLYWVTPRGHPRARVFATQEAANAYRFPKDGDRDLIQTMSVAELWNRVCTHDPAWVEANKEAITAHLASTVATIGAIWDRAEGTDPNAGKPVGYGATPNRKSMTYKLRKAAGFAYP